MWCEDELKAPMVDLAITDGEPELRDLYWALYRDGAQREWAYWEERLRQELWKPLAKGRVGVDRLISDLRQRGQHSAATYLRNAQDDLFNVTRLKEQGIAPELVMVATGAVEREFREINQRTEIGARWSDEGVERVARLLEEVRLNGKFEF
jgi:hypothetical protein